tara:strand:+ start:482 stop:1333 length:852 start_codon:yes stop_codon:yes gene_type:complete
MRKIRVKRLTEADLGDTSGEFDRLRDKMIAANIIGDGGMISTIDTPDEFRDLIRLLAYETGVPNDQLGPYLSAVTQEFQKGKYDQPEEVEETIQITVGGLKAIIREELEKEDQDPDDLVLVTIDAPADEKEAQKLAVKTVMDPNDQAESFFVSDGKIHFFASADDMKAWTAMTRSSRMDKPAPAPAKKPLTQMSDEELLDSLPVGTLASASRQSLFKGVREDDPVPTPREDLKHVMDKWESVKDTPGATLTIKKYPPEYKKMHRFDRGRPNMIWGDVDYPSLD